MALKKTGIKFVDEEITHERSISKSLRTLSKSEHPEDSKKDSRKSDSSVVTNVSLPLDESPGRGRSVRNFSIYGIQNKNFRQRQTLSTASRKTITLQPTYQLTPSWPFERSYVMQIMDQSINKSFAGYQYDSKTIDRLCQRTTIAMEKRISGLRFNRYKIVCVVIAGEKFYQDLMITAGFLLDKDTDAYCTYLLERPNFFAMGVVFGVYYN